MSQRRRKQSTSASISWLNVFLWLVFLILSAFTLTTLFTNHFLNFWFLNVAILAVSVVVLIATLLMIWKNRARKTTTVLLLLFTALSGAGLWAMRSVIDVVGDLNESTSYTEYQMSIVVRKDSPISSLEEVNNLVSSKQDPDNTKELLDHIASDKNVTLTATEADSYQAAYEQVLADGNTAMVLNSAYASLLEQEDPQYADQLKTIYSYTIKRFSEPTPTQANADSFTIYISGIDTFGPINTVSRSDVNILMTVNLKTRKVLLTTTPRDAYVKIPGGGQNQYDKLTHAGIYGVETSEQTLENLYGIQIDYYARINFTSFVSLIDELGGIEVYNDQAFTSRYGKYDIPVGNVTLNSDQALGFVRERYSLDGGDNDRGRNQEKVISAIVKKLASVNTLTKLPTIVSVLKDSVQTNMSVDTIMSLANSQLGGSGEFTVTSQAVTGHGSTGELTSFAMPNASLYMMQLDEQSVADAKQAIQDTMEGK